MTLSTRQIAQRLARNTLAVCAHYLSNGKRNGRYWVVGDPFNTKGRSMYVRLTGPDYGPGAAGKWTDAATGEHGDLLDIIALSLNITPLAARAEALRFLAEPQTAHSHKPAETVARNSPEAARRLFAAASPVIATPAERYLRARAITCPLNLPALRFHPSCYHLDDTGTRRSTPAIVAAITDNGGTLTGVQRIFLTPDGVAKADIPNPKRALGDVLGHAIRIGGPKDVMAVGEGLETMLSIRSLMPELPVAAATSANHLAVFVPPPGLQRLYIAHDNGKAGIAAARLLKTQANTYGIHAHFLTPPGHDDWNTDLQQHTRQALCAMLAHQLADADRHLIAAPQEELS